VSFDEHLADRVRERLGGIGGITELKMFGGWGVTIHGNMAVGVMDSDLIVRVGPDAYEAALKRVGSRPFDFTGRAMTGWVFVDGTAVATARTLDRWVTMGVSFAQSLPAKRAKPRPRRNTTRPRR